MTGPCRGNWLQTFSGRRFYPADPRAEDVCIEDIAHGLSNLCRFAGQCSKFFSVAEHSVLVSQCVPPEHAMQALLHDATEAYLVDIPRPVKVLLPGYGRYESMAWAAVAARFGVPVDMHPSVKQADNDVLLAERDALFPDDGHKWSVPGAPARVEILGLPPHDAKRFFLARFLELNQRKAAPVAEAA